MKSAFDADSADLTGMLPKSVDSLFVAGRGAPTDVVKLTVDRPFVFGVRDIATGAFVFLGRVTKP